MDEIELGVMEDQKGFDFLFVDTCHSGIRFHGRSEESEETLQWCFEQWYLLAILMMFI